VISLEYTVNEDIHNVPRRNLKTIQEYGDCTFRYGRSNWDISRYGYSICV